MFKFTNFQNSESTLVQYVRRAVLVTATAAFFAASIQAQAAQETKWVAKERKCTETSNPDDIKVWVTTYSCETTQGVANQPYSFKAAVLAHDDWGAPTSVTVTDENGEPLHMNGVLVEFTSNQAAAQEANHLYGSEPGFSWYGFRSTEEIPSVQGDGSAIFSVEYKWVSPNELPDEPGAAWLSDNGDDLYGYRVTDAYNEYPRFASVVSSAADNPFNLQSIQNYPNPVVNTGTVQYTLESAADVTVELLNQAGQVVNILSQGRQDVGTFSVNYNTNDLAAGVYFARLSSGETFLTQKLIVVK